MALSLALRDIVRNLFLIRKILKELYVTRTTINTGIKNSIGKWSVKKFTTPNRACTDM